MSDLLELYVLFVLIYLFECAEWVPRRAVGFTRVLGVWRIQRARSPNPRWDRGFLFGEPWPPLSSCLMTDPLPLLLGPGGISRPTESANFLAWSEAGNITAVDARLLINGRLVMTFATRRGARALAETLAGMDALPKDQRIRRLEGLLDMRFDPIPIRERLARWSRQVRWAQLSANLLWVALFGGIPAMVWTPASRYFLPLLGLILLLWMLSVVLFERALRKSEPRPDLVKRLVAASSPLTSVRALDHLARELVGDLDPLVVAASLVGPEALAALARTRLVELTYARAGAANQNSQEDAGWWRAQMLRRIQDLLRARNIDPERLLAPPKRDREDLFGWCPVCLAQFAPDAAKSCPNAGCDDIPLQPF